MDMPFAFFRLSFPDTWFHIQSHTQDTVVRRSVVDASLLVLRYLLYLQAVQELQSAIFALRRLRRHTRGDEARGLEAERH